MPSLRIRLALLALALSALTVAAVEVRRTPAVGTAPSDRADHVHAQGPMPETLARIEDALIGTGFDQPALVRAHCGFDETGAYRPDYGSADFNPSRRLLGSEHRADLDALADSFGVLVESTARTAMDVLHAELSSVVGRGEFLVRPASTPGEVEELRRSTSLDTRSAFSYATSFLQEGWFIAVSIDSNDHPEFGRAMHELYDMRQERDRALRQYIAALP